MRAAFLACAWPARSRRKPEGRLLSCCEKTAVRAKFERTRPASGQRSIPERSLVCQWPSGAIVTAGRSYCLRTRR